MRKPIKRPAGKTVEVEQCRAVALDKKAEVLDPKAAQTMMAALGSKIHALARLAEETYVAGQAHDFRCDPEAPDPQVCCHAAAEIFCHCAIIGEHFYKMSPSDFISFHQNQRKLFDLVLRFLADTYARRAEHHD